MVESKITEQINLLFKEESGGEDLSSKIVFSPTRKEFEGDMTLVVFPFVKMAKKNPVETANLIGELLKTEITEIEDYNVIKGFLNLSFSNAYWIKSLGLQENLEQLNLPAKDEKILIEFSSPNTNKPLHLGHIRNILLGSSTSNLLKAAGHEVVNTQIVNDRGIAICKSMLAWSKYGNGDTPESTSIKGDHFVGKYYVLFETKFKEEYALWQASPEGQALYESEKKEGVDQETYFKKYKNNYFNTYSTLGKEAKEMLQKWEAKETETIALWEQMNGWVYAGFDETYERLGAEFDLLYYESDTYILGKDVINKGLEEGSFYKKDDGSVWIDLEDVGLDHKLVLRSDGTSVYMTQDIGTVDKRYENHGTKKMIYVVANEQDYHFKALFEICKKLNRPFAEGLYHLSYGMVDLPEGKMKSREGTVVDADDLMDEVINEAKLNAEEREVQLDISEAEKNEIYRKIGLGALKYFMLKVGPKKRMVFNPKDSVDMQGDTGPYIQNAYVRIQSVLRNMNGSESGDYKNYGSPEGIEKDLLTQLSLYPSIIEEAAAAYDPSSIAAYAYQLSRSYHRFYHDVRILKAETPEAKAFRLVLSKCVARNLKHAMAILGIEMPEKM
jgi:arginyl-tRNA synthetase